MFRPLLTLTLVLTLGLGAGLYVASNRAAGPTIEILQPTDFVGRSAVFQATIDAPGSRLTAVEVIIEQNEEQFLLFSLSRPTEAEIDQDGPDRVRITRPFDRESHPELRSGTARLRVSARRPVLFGLRETSSSVAVDVEVRLEPPRISIVSNFHYINHGGAELVVYKISPPDSSSGVRVGDRTYPGYAAPALGTTNDKSLRIALFALLHDQDLDTPINLYARDKAGNEAQAEFDHQRFPKEFRRSRIPVSDRFLRQVVPRILERVSDLSDEDPDGSDQGWLDLYLFINDELRRRNRKTLAALAVETTEQMLWEGPFLQLSNSKVESGFADHRTYVHGGKEIDQQVHLGFDLASTANAPILAANHGTVIYADYLGIFGNCVVIDHGIGLQTLYAHLSSIAVSRGDQVQQNAHLGLSGQTGLAGGDHLHYATLLQGHPVSPIEWWDSHWIEDRILRKLQAAFQDTSP